MHGRVERQVQDLSPFIELGVKRRTPPFPYPECTHIKPEAQDEREVHE